MSDGHGPSPETPPGWAAEQPPPYGAPQVSPWTAPGHHQQPPPGTPPQQPYQPPYQQPQPQRPQPGYGYMPPPPALRPGIIPLRPLGLGDILDGTIKLIRSNPKTVLGLSAIAALLAAVPIAVGQAFVFDSMGGVLADPSAAPADVSELYGGFLAQYGGTLISLVVSFVVVTVLTGVLTRILGRAVFGGKITASEAWQLTKGRIPALFGVVALMAVIMLVPLVVFVGVLVAIFATGGGSPAGLVVFMILFFLAYVAYVLWCKTRFAFAPPAVVLEGRGPIDAMRRSWNLVTGDFWRVFGILLLTSILVGIVSGVLEIPFSLAGGLVGMLGTSSLATALAAVLIALGATVGSMIAYPFEAGIAGLLYADRRMRAEAFDLVLQTAAIEQQRQGWVHASADELWHPSDTHRS